ncbi:MAG: hypothetical protein V1916_03640 [Patescibacteria group bacterium]
MVIAPAAQPPSAPAAGNDRERRRAWKRMQAQREQEQNTASPGPSTGSQNQNQITEQQAPAGPTGAGSMPDFEMGGEESGGESFARGSRGQDGVIPGSELHEVEITNKTPDPEAEKKDSTTVDPNTQARSGSVKDQTAMSDMKSTMDALSPKVDPNSAKDQSAKSNILRSQDELSRKVDPNSAKDQSAKSSAETSGIGGGSSASAMKRGLEAAKKLSPGNLKNLKDAAVEQATQAASMMSARALSACWQFLLPSFGLTLIWLNIHLVGRYIFRFQFLCAFGDEWNMMKGNPATAGGPQMSVPGLQAAEIMAVLVLDVLLAAIIAFAYIMLQVIGCAMQPWNLVFGYFTGSRCADIGESILTTLWNLIF